MRALYKQVSTPSKVIKIHLNPKTYTWYTSQRTILFFEFESSGLDYKQFSYT